MGDLRKIIKMLEKGCVESERLYNYLKRLGAKILYKKLKKYVWLKKD